MAQTEEAEEAEEAEEEEDKIFSLIRCQPCRQREILQGSLLHQKKPIFLEIG
jgi:hypothetical protein